MMESVIVYTDAFEQQHWELLRLTRRTAVLKDYEGLEASFSLKTGAPLKGQGLDRHYIKKAELRWLRDRALEQHGASGPRRSIADDLARHLLRHCPLTGHWMGFAEVSVSLKPPTDRPLAYARRRRVDIGYLESQRTRGGRQFRAFGVEVKSCRADFTRDQKWPAYMNRLHGFAFACPPDTIKRSELPGRVGLYYWSAGELVCIRAPVMLEELPLDILADTYRGFALSGYRMREG